MPRKKTLIETQPEAKELPAELTAGANAAPELLPEPTETVQDPVFSEEPSAEEFSENEQNMSILPIGGDYPSGGGSPDIVFVELESGGNGETLSPGAEIPYGEESGELPPTDGEVNEPASESVAQQPSETESPVDERRAFFGLDFRELDRNLTPEQQQEWNSIYASYRGRSVMRGQVVGVDQIRIRTRDRSTGEMVWQRMYCAIVIPFRVRILIPESEMWMEGGERPNFVLRNIAGANIDFVIISVDREGGLAIGSRRMALPSRRFFLSTQANMNHPGSRISCDVLVVGPRRCLVSCNGYDIDLTQRDMSYTAIADLRDKYHSGDLLNCIVKEYDRRRNHLVISVKETVPNPFDGAEFRHPQGSHRCAVIAGKYAGGAFCNLPDGVTIMCNYAFHYDDSSFSAGDKVMLVIQRYDMGKKQIYGKIVAKV